MVTVHSLCTMFQNVHHYSLLIYCIYESPETKQLIVVNNMFTVLYRDRPELIVRNSAEIET